jgi:hypothetical protein
LAGEFFSADLAELFQFFFMCSLCFHVLKKACDYFILEAGLKERFPENDLEFEGA